MDPCALLKKNYLKEEDIIKTIRYAIENNEPLSMVRVGDGEGYVLAQENVFPIEWIRQNIYWVDDPNYCGVTIPNLEARDRCLTAVKNAELVGVFADQDVPQAIFKAYNIIPKNIFYAFTNVGLPMSIDFVKIIVEHPPLLVGRPAERFAQFLSDELGITCPWLTGMESYKNVDKIIDKMAKIPHKWSLISAGVNALIIADTMAHRYGKVAIDFGHAPDMVLDHEEYWLAKP